MAEGSEESLKIEREEMCRVLGCDLIYHASWMKGSGKPAKSPSLNGVDHYTVYTVTVSYQGKSRSHQGLILYYKQSGKGTAYKIADGMIPSINSLTQDNQPQARGSRSQYVESKRNGTTRNLRKKQSTTYINPFCVGCHIDGWTPAAYGIVGMQIPVYVWVENESHIPMYDENSVWEWDIDNGTEISADNSWVWHWECPWEECDPWAWGNTLMVAPSNLNPLEVEATATGIRDCYYGGSAIDGTLNDVYALHEVIGPEMVAVGDEPVLFHTNHPYPNAGDYEWELSDPSAGILSTSSSYPYPGSCHSSSCYFWPQKAVSPWPNIIVNFHPYMGSDFFAINSKQVKVFEVELRNPIDTNADGKVNDFATAANNRAGNAFGYDRSTPNICTIPVRVKIEPDTAENRTLLANKATVTLDAITNAGFTSSLTWNHAVAGNPSVGNLQYESASGLWEATATFSGLPAIPTGSWGRVPAGLRNLLYGVRHATVTVANPYGGGNLSVKTESYEIYFGDSLVINGQKMAETTENYTNHIQALVAPGSLYREI
jgi:hypothetical protein